MSDERPTEGFEQHLRSLRAVLPNRSDDPPEPIRARWSWRTRTIVGLMILIGFALLIFAAVSVQAADCAIKGNVSRSGAQIYRLPSSPAYSSVVIDTAKSGADVLQRGRSASGEGVAADA